MVGRKRGRPSAAELAVAAPGLVESIPRPDAPYDLTDEETVEWWAIVNRMAADWFPRETQPLLAQLCRHIVQARRIAQLIDAALKDPAGLDLAAYDKLTKMQSRESERIASLSTKLRLSQSATTRTETARKPSLMRKPWQKQ